jgi:hypothetical protein
MLVCVMLSAMLFYCYAESRYVKCNGSHFLLSILYYIFGIIR